MTVRGGALAVALLLGACATGRGASGHAPSSAPAATALPANGGRELLTDGGAILRRTCTQCHDLGGLSAFADYWGEPEWASMVETMISYGAVIDPREVPILVTWLGEHY